MLRVSGRVEDAMTATISNSGADQPTKTSKPEVGHSVTINSNTGQQVRMLLDNDGSVDNGGKRIGSVPSLLPCVDSGIDD
jgi:hypothetical protein